MYKIEKEVNRIEDLDFEKQGGLITVVAQDVNNKEVLMVAYMNKETLQQTLDTGLCTYWSRSRQEVWVKGKTSGSTQKVREMFL